MSILDEGKYNLTRNKQTYFYQDLENELATNDFSVLVKTETAIDAVHFTTETNNFIKVD